MNLIDILLELLEQIDYPSLILFCISIAFYAAKEKLVHHYSTSIFSDLNPQYWDANISWKNKYAWDENGELIPVTDDNVGCTLRWYYSLFNLQYIERFFLSATMFVFITDGMHLMQFFFKNLMILSIAVLLDPCLYWFVIYYLAWAVVWNLFYSIILNK